MADVTISLIHKDNGLYYKTDQMKDYEKMGEDSTVGVDSSQTIAWICGDDSIEKINSIDVNLEKSGGKNWKDIYVEVPRGTDPEGKCWEGLIKSERVQKEKREYNGYDITYQPTGAKPITVDPTVTIPPV